MTISAEPAHRASRRDAHELTDGRLADAIENAAAAAAQLSRNGDLDGDRALRLIDASYALRRAAIALADLEEIRTAVLDLTSEET